MLVVPGLRCIFYLNYVSLNRIYEYAQPLSDETDLYVYI